MGRPHGPKVREKLPVGPRFLRLYALRSSFAWRRLTFTFRRPWWVESMTSLMPLSPSRRKSWIHPIRHYFQSWYSLLFSRELVQVHQCSVFYSAPVSMLCRYLCQLPLCTSLVSRLLCNDPLVCSYCGCQRLLMCIFSCSGAPLY